MNILDLLNSNLLDLVNDKSEKIDLSTLEGYEKYKTLINELESTVKDNWLFSGIFTPEVIENLKTFGKTAYEEAMKKNKEVTLNEPKEENVFPSSKIKNIDTKMQIHRLTQEYVDTMLKPYMEKGPNTTNNINNAYTALFEFACWIFNHK